MTLTPYRDSGLVDVFVDGPDMRVEEDGEEMLMIRSIGRLHLAIAEALVSRPWPLAGRELRFLRTEIGEDPETFAEAAGLPAPALCAVESGSDALDPASEDRIRLLAVDRLQLPVAANRATAPRMARPSPAPAIVIEAVGERNYAVRPLETASAARETPARTPVIPSPVDVGRAGIRAAVGWLQTTLDGLGPLPAPVKARRNDRLPPEEAWAELLRARLPEDLSDDLLWAPVAKDDLGNDGLVLTFLWRGEDTPVEPRVELFQGDTPLAPGKIRLTPGDGTLAVRLPALGPGPHDIATATPNEGSLVVRIDVES